MIWYDMPWYEMKLYTIVWYYMISCYIVWYCWYHMFVYAGAASNDPRRFDNFCNGVLLHVIFCIFIWVGWGLITFCRLFFWRLLSTLSNFCFTRCWCYASTLLSCNYLTRCWCYAWHCFFLNFPTSWTVLFQHKVYIYIYVYVYASGGKTVLAFWRFWICGMVAHGGWGGR